MKFNSPGLDFRFVARTVLTVIALAALAIPFVLQAQTSVNVTTTVHDLSVGGVALNTLSDLYQGGATHSATYNSSTCAGKHCDASLGSSVAAGWSLTLYTQSIRKIVLNLNSVASGPPVFNPPLNAAISEKVEIYTQCYDPSSGVRKASPQWQQGRYSIPADLARTSCTTMSFIN